MIKIRSPRFVLIGELLLFTLCILVFAFFASRNFPYFLISLGGLFVAAIIIVKNIYSFRNFLDAFGIAGFTKSIIYFLPIALLFGLFFGIVYRNYLDLSFFPARLTYFAMIGALIGSTEELLFRGFLQTQIRKFNIPLSIFLATLAHTCYKLVIFISLQSLFEINLSFLVIWTMVCGFILGVIKEYSKNIIYPVLGHALFDIIVYGDRTVIPWWVWG